MVVAASLVIGTGFYVGFDFSRAQERANTPSSVALTSVANVTGEPRVVFRNTEIGSKYGLVAMVGLADPRGARALTDVACERVYATADEATCLHTKRGIATTFEALQLDTNWKVEKVWALPGIPSRTRISADGRLIGTTTFVSGHSYMQVGFSTATEIRDVEGHKYGNLEKFDLVIDAKMVSPSDRNIWGVTFAGDGNTFYATAATGGETYLVRGDLDKRTLTSVRRTAECPSLSPDGTTLAYKKAVEADGPTAHWSIAVLDLATGREEILAGESRSVDDQVEWLDDNTLLYGMPRTEEAGVTDVWSIRTDSGAKPEKFIDQAWSPSVVRG